MRKKIISLFRGWLGEKKAAFFLWLSLMGQRKSYHTFHNIIIPSKNGTAQIDHLIISVYGLFIVETKNKKGWIFGSGNQATWTQSIFGNNYTFQNPLKQTYRQKKVLSKFLSNDKSNIKTVVYFVGNCAFKTQLPDNVIRSGLGRFIKKFQEKILTAEQVDQLVSKIDRHVSESSLSKRDHIKSLKKRHSSDSVCPRCGSALIQKTARQGANAGSTFLGCTNYPRCRFTKDA